MLICSSDICDDFSWGGYQDKGEKERSGSGHNLSMFWNQVLKVCLEQIKDFHILYKGIVLALHNQSINIHVYTIKVSCIEVTLYAANAVLSYVVLSYSYLIGFDLRHGIIIWFDLRVCMFSSADQIDKYVKRHRDSGRREPPRYVFYMVDITVKCYLNYHIVAMLFL